jgi:hypothetical protein
VGQTQTITWTSTAISGSVKIEVLRSDGSGLYISQTLAAAAPNTGSFSWLVSGPSPHARVLISDVSHTATNSASAADFAITAPLPAIQVTSPNGGENWAVGSPQTVTWTATGLSGTVSVDLSRDGGATFTTLGTPQVGAGAFGWTVTGPAASTAMIRLLQVTNGTSYSSTSGSFTIAGGGVPAAPSDLTATALSSTNIRLNWMDHATDESGYKVEARTGASPYQEITGLTLGPGAAVQTLTGAQPSTTYYFRVHAYNAAGDSAYSNEASVTTPDAPVPPPAAPTALKAKPQSGTVIVLTWRPRSSNEQGFKVEILRGGVFVEIGTLAAGSIGVRVTNLSPRTTYSFRVRAYNAGGNSAYSNVASAKTKNR